MNYNPGDHYINVLAITPGEEEKCRAKVSAICDAFDDSKEGKEVYSVVAYEASHMQRTPQLEAQSASDKASPYKANWMEQFSALLWRSWISNIKEPMIIQVRFFQTVVSVVESFTPIFSAIEKKNTNRSSSPWFLD